MAKGGSKPGERRGGRAKGVPNKRTVEARERQRLESAAKQAARDVEIAARAKIKLGKDVLEDYMVAFGAIAAIYQNRVAEALQKNVPPAATDLAAFEQWGSLTVNTAKALADFQSPKFKAIMVSAPPPDPNANQPQDGTVISIDDPVALARVYKRRIQGVG